MGIEHIRMWKAEGFRLDLWDTGKVDSLGKSVLHYCLFDGQWQNIRGVDSNRPDRRGIIFEGSDYAVGHGTCIDSDAAVAGLLSFLSLGEGDTDADYFAAYTPAQLEWRDSGRREALSLLAYELENPEEVTA